MRKKTRYGVQIALILAFLLGTLTPTGYANTQVPPKMMLIYVDKYVGSSGIASYPSYSAADIDSLLAAGVTDFVLLGGSYQVYQDSESSYKTQLAVSMANTASLIIQRSSLARIWIGTPGLDSTTPTSSFGTRLTPFKNYLAEVKTLMGATNWNNNIQGIYMNGEAIYPAVNYANLLANPQIALYKNLSTYIHDTLGKEFLWIPYYGYGANAAEIIKRIGYVTNSTFGGESIFDIVLLQPHYYFDSTVQSNLNGVKHSVNNQAISYRDNVIVTPRGTGATVRIGIEMEIDTNYASNTAYQGRYAEYVSAFSTYLGAQPFAYYAGSRTSVMNGAVLGQIEEFYE
ncbi:DUF4855 domain-containing protein [Paenibacillus sp. PAMC21692]|uniref:DUF4855 domain-containing protein n=1 Tax=Paenibacillus sp. PAMC21692 TaxID=2762320 RepID=UPI00164EAFEB|nr:DUF4855 domain-containing protein [Paenibacillus sp. PAMC21692]QNK56985.1 DUF4855 domain-containing protein [Paenibacillus sp. PAMC21692]